MAQEGFDPPNPPAPFVGREKDLAWLEQHATPRVGLRFENDVSIIGEGGIGKTALVAEFLSRHKETFLAIWVDCASWASTTPDLRGVFGRFERKVSQLSRGSRGITVILDGLDGTSERAVFDLYFGIRNRKMVGSIITTSRSSPQLRIVPENLLELSGLPKAEIERLIHDKVSLADLGENETLRLLAAVNGHPAAAQIFAGMARALSSDQLRRFLSGEIYDLGGIKPDVSATKIGRVVKPLIVADNEKILRNLKKQPSDVLKLTPRQFEELVADLLQDMGYEVTLTQQTRDGGKDILAAKKTEIGNILCLVDAKRYKQTFKIGVGMVRTLLGTLADYGATSAMLATTSTYSKDARTMEERHKYKLTLKDYVDVAEWVHKYGE